MRLILRILGTWLLGMALILVIIDGTRMLAASNFHFTSLADEWNWVHPQSLAWVRDFIGGRLFAPLLQGVTDLLLGCWAWAVLLVPGALLAWAGRSRRTRLFVRHDQI